jgi:hypothetical protein
LAGEQGPGAFAAGRLVRQARGRNPVDGIAVWADDVDWIGHISSFATLHGQAYFIPWPWHGGR